MNAAGVPEGTPEQRDKGHWSEVHDWGWKFKGDDAWLTVAFEKGKHFKTGELRALPKENAFQLKLETLDGRKLVYTGEFKERYLTLERHAGLHRPGRGVRLSAGERDHPPGRFTAYLRRQRAARPGLDRPPRDQVPHPELGAAEHAQAGGLRSVARHNPALSIGAGALSLVIELLTIFFLVLLLLIEAPKMRVWTLSQMEQARAAKATSVAAEVNQAVAGYMLGNLMTWHTQASSCS